MSENIGGNIKREEVADTEKDTEVKVNTDLKIQQAIDLQAQLVAADIGEDIDKDGPGRKLLSVSKNRLFVDVGFQPRGDSRGWLPWEKNSFFRSEMNRIEIMEQFQPRNSPLSTFKGGRHLLDKFGNFRDFGLLLFANFPASFHVSCI